MARSAAEILLVEDNPGDQRLMVEALKEAGWTGLPHIVGNGADAIAYLRENPRKQRPDLKLIILDLNLPGKDGRELLAEIRQDPEWGEVPVVVLSSSKAHEDISQSFELNADGYITKPFDLEEYYEAIRGLERFYR